MLVLPSFQVIEPPSPPGVHWEMACWLVGCRFFWVPWLLVGWLVCGLLRLACWLAGWLVGWLVDFSVWFVGQLGVHTCAVACCVLAGRHAACFVVLLCRVCVWEQVCGTLQGS